MEIAIKDNSKTSAIGAAIIIFALMGNSNIIAIIAPFFISEIGISLTKIGAVSTFAAVTSIIMSFFNAKFITKLTPKWCIMIGSIMSSAHLYVFGAAKNEFALYAGAIMTGFALGIGAHAATASLINGWYNMKKANALTGAIFAASVFGGTVYTFVGARIMNAAGWRTMCFALGTFSMVLVIIVNLLLVRNVPKGWIPALDSSAPDDTPKEAALTGVTYSEAVRTPCFYLFFIGIVVLGMVIAISNFSSAFWTAGGMDPAVAATNFSLLTLFGGLIMLSGGFMVNKLGTRGYVTLLVVVYLIGIISGLVWLGSGSRALAILMALGFSVATVITGTPSLFVNDCFGNRDYARIASTGSAAFYIGSAVTTIITGRIATVAGYKVMLIYLGCIAVIAMVLLFIASAVSPMRKNRAR